MSKNELLPCLVIVGILGVQAFPDAVATLHQPLTREATREVIAQIQRADYEGDRAALARLREALPAVADDTALLARLHYWRGFAMWRRALNGFNDGVAAAALEQDLAECVTEFRAALAAAPGWSEAKIGIASCLVNQSFLGMRRNDPSARELFTASVVLMNDVRQAAPDNPRFLWVEGANQWYAPSERGGGQEKAIATYERGLASARRTTNSGSDLLDPTWGEPELLMNLAFAELNRATPDREAAERRAREALALVPHWHYVRDLLLPQIVKSK